MKKFLKVILSSMLITVLVAACGSPGSTEGGDDDQITITVSWWGSEGRHNAMQDIAALYMEQNPGVRVETQFGPWSGWQANILTQLSGQVEPDVMQVNYNWVHSFGEVNQNVFYNLFDLADYLYLGYWDDYVLESMIVNGELAAVPHGINARINMYNTLLFDEYGITYPTTYDELMAAGAIIGANNTLTGADNKYILTSIGAESTDLLIATMLYNQTGRVMQENGKVNYTVEDVKRVLEFFEKFENSGAMPNFHQEDPIQNESNPVWTGGRSGSVFEWVSGVDKYAETFLGGNHEQYLGVAPFPTETGEPGVVFIKPSLGYAVSRNSSHPEIAADFINFMFTNEEAIMILDSTLGVSVHSITREIQEREGLIQNAMRAGLELLDNSHQVFMDPFFEDESVRGARIRAIEAFRTESLDSTEAAIQYIEEQQRELDRLFS